MITRIACHLPQQELTNEDLALRFSDWTAEKIFEKTGIRRRRIAAPGECSSDLAAMAADKLLKETERRDIGFLLFCTQSPDYFLPTSACLLQQRLGLPTNCGALDFNLGCSGYVYGLALAHGLVAGGLVRRVLLLTGETYSKFLDESDRATRTIFGDAGTATLLDAAAGSRLHSFVFGTDGSGGTQLILERGGFRGHRSVAADGHGGVAGRISPECLFMNGPEVFNFTLRVVPPLVESIAARAGLKLDEVDRFVFHQANAFMLEHLRRRLQIPKEKFCLCLENWGNTVSNTIPLALQSELEAGRIQPGMRVMLVAFGVGLSWGGCILEWSR